MAKTDIEAVILQISADLKQYNRGLKKLEKDTGDAVEIVKKKFDGIDHTINKLGGSFEKAGKKMGGVGSEAVKSIPQIAAGVAAFSSVQGVIGLATEAMKEFTAIGKQAGALGISTDFLQELRFAANGAAVEAERVDDAMKEFGLRVGELQVNSGSLYGALQSVNPALIDQLKAATSLEAKFKVLADAMKLATNEQERLVLADAAFSDAGFDLVAVLSKGSAALEEQAARAKELGVIVDEQLIRQATELQSEYGDLSSVIDLKLKQSFIELAPVLIEVLDVAARVASSIAAIVDSSRDLEDRSTAGLELKLRALKGEREKYRDVPPVSEVSRFNLRGYSIARMADDNRDRVDVEIAEVEDELAAREVLRYEASKPKPAYVPRAGTPAAPGPSGGGAKAPARPQRSDADREAEQLARTMEGLQREIELVGLSNTEKRVMNALRSAGVEASSAEGRSVAELVRRLEAETAAMETIEERQKAIGETSREISDVLVNGFGNAIMGAATYKEALSGVLQGLMQLATQAALFGEGPLAKLLGTSAGGGVSGGLAGLLSGSVGQIFGASISPATAGMIQSGKFAGLFDKGGTIPAGAFGIAGEVGPEIIRGPATVLSRDRTSGLFDRLAQRSEGPSGAPVYVTITTPDPGAFRQSQGQTTAAIARAVAHGRRSL